MQPEFTDRTFFVMVLADIGKIPQYHFNIFMRKV